MSDFYVSFLTPLAPYFMQKYHADTRQIALFITAISFISSIFQIFFGTLSDKIESRFKFIYILTTITVLFISVIEFAPNIFVLFLFFIIAFFANSAFHPMGAAAAHSLSVKSMPFFVAAGTLGTAVGPIFVTIFSSKIGLKFLWLVGLPVLIILAFMIKSEPPLSHIRTNTESVKINSKQKKILFDLWLLVTARTLVMSIGHLYAPIMSTQKGFSLVFGGTLLSIGVAIGVFTTMLGSWLSNKFGNLITNLISFLGMGIALLIFVRASDMITLLIGYVLIDGFGYLTMSSNLSQAQIALPNHTSFASSVVMGFAWACGTGLRVFMILPFGDNIGVIIYLTILISLLMAFIVFLKGRKACFLRNKKA
ncbi:MFS transporter [Thermotoga profunda]|uniref:MFS transporter n=1 Tax=Thermotoga profunda TaxID=1508420 RepID=UPI000596CD2A|nr:MFS transporter [Thermotoga profunda]